MQTRGVRAVPAPSFTLGTSDLGRVLVKRLPLIPTILVALAVATMIGLGVWQLQRASWKEGLLAHYAANSGLPPIAYPSVPVDTQSLLFRRAAGFCLNPVSIRATAGRDMSGTSGWSHVASCRTGGIEGPGMTVDIGWSARFDTPVAWRGGTVQGVIAPSGKNAIRLVASNPAPGLRPSEAPGPDVITNNHRFYAVQWFFFAAVAALIYGLALRQRRIKQAL